MGCFEEKVGIEMKGTDVREVSLDRLSLQPSGCQLRDGWLRCSSSCQVTGTPHGPLVSYKLLNITAFSTGASTFLSLA